MTRNEFAGYYSFYGWKKVNGIRYHITLEHENGVSLQISYARLYRMNDDDIIKLLREASKKESQ